MSARGVHRALLVCALVALSHTVACGATYVQPPMPTAEASGPVLPLRALSLSFDRGTASVDAAGVMSFDGNVVGTFAESGSFTVTGGTVWAQMNEAGEVTVSVDDPAAPAPSTATFTTSGGRLVRPDGQVLATLDASGQLVTASGTFAVSGISTRVTRLALFLYLVAATYADEAAAPAGD
jgi:hypothetical protein